MPRDFAGAGGGIVCGASMGEETERLSETGVAIGFGGANLAGSVMVRWNRVDPTTMISPGLKGYHSEGKRYPLRKVPCGVCSSNMKQLDPSART